MSDETSVFETLRVVDCEKHVEQKGKFSYLSWSWAVDALLERYPKATWEVVKSQDGEPYLVTALGMYFVEVAVTVEGIKRSHIHPVLDNKNRPIEKPDSFQINTSIMRCLVKTIALHGLGLYIYAGEDLPPDADATPKRRKKARSSQEEDSPSKAPEPDEKSELRTALRHLVVKAKKRGWTFEGIKDAFQRNDRDLDLATREPEGEDVLILQGLINAGPSRGVGELSDAAPF